MELNSNYSNNSLNEYNKHSHTTDYLDNKNDSSNENRQNHYYNEKDSDICNENSIITVSDSLKLINLTRKQDYNYYVQFYYPIILMNCFFVILFFIMPFWPPVYFILINNNKGYDRHNNIKLSYFFVRYNHKLYSYYDCFDKCNLSYNVDESKCSGLDMENVIVNFQASCDDYNKAKIIFLIVSALLRYINICKLYYT